MKGVILDADSLGPGVDLLPITNTLDEWQVYPSTLSDQVAARINDADIVLTNKTVIAPSALAGASKLKFISVIATGTNNVDLKEADRLGIQVSNAVAYGTPSIVQHTISLILALSTHMPAYIDDVRRGMWQKSSNFSLLHHPIQEIAGKTLGVIGYGILGRSVAAACEALGMQILVAERKGAPVRGNRMDFDELICQVDYLSLHCPLVDTTENLINEKTLAQMKPSSFLINTARGALVDSSALLTALENKTIAGAAIDVLMEEPPLAREPLTSARLPNLIVTPHNAWGAIESRQRLILQMHENIVGFLSGSAPRRVTGYP